MRILVTGGAGYIGSHTVIQLVAAGHEPVIIDNFSNAKPAVLDRLAQITGREIPCVTADLTDISSLQQVFSQHGPIDAVIHFAGLKAVGESVEIPLAYYRNNLVSTMNLAEVMSDHDVRTLVFSSSATVYGADASSPLTEDLPTSATNPYGWTKVMCERILTDVAAADPRWRLALLRYFNPVGAHPSGLIGEDPLGRPNNLMPVLAQVAVGRLPQVQVFGNDYPTPDGTGVRDYIHVDDLAAGHLAAMERLTTTDRAVNTWNLGTGQGVSVLELLRAFETASGRTLAHQIVGRRAGDIAECYADPSRAENELGWRATRTVQEMCADTWRWQQSNPQGYPE